MLNLIPAKIYPIKVTVGLGVIWDGRRFEAHFFELTVGLRLCISIL